MKDVGSKLRSVWFSEELEAEAIFKNYIKPPKEPQGYRRYHASGRETMAIQWKRKNIVGYQAWARSQHYRNYTGEHSRPVSSLLKKLIRRKNKNSQGHQLAWCLCIMSFEYFVVWIHWIYKLGSPSLHCLIWFSRWCPWLVLFFRLMSSLSKDETGRGCLPV